MTDVPNDATVAGNPAQVIHADCASLNN
jgi:serine acetyltransferase